MTSHKKINTRYHEIWIDETGVLRVVTTESCEVDLEEAMACFAVYEKLGCKENRTVQLLDARVGVTITKEARDYAAKRGPFYFMASAIISDSLTTRLMVNFFVKLYPDTVPFKMFSNEADALKWLNQHRP
ncbi:MAG: hypothetical protein ACHQF2_11300 [Flavobacteriales bacterium]